MEDESVYGVSNTRRIYDETDYSVDPNAKQPASADDEAVRIEGEDAE